MSFLERYPGQKFIEGWTKSEPLTQVNKEGRLLRVENNWGQVRERLNDAWQVGLILVGPSGSGKDTMIETLDKTKFTMARTITTRKKRDSETGYDPYIRKTPEELEELYQAGQIVERQKYADNWYATYRPEINEAIASGKIPIFRIEWKGAKKLLRLQEEGEEAFRYLALVVVFMCPVNCEQLVRNVVGRDLKGERDRKKRDVKKEIIRGRMDQAEIDLAEMVNVAHYVAVNEPGEENFARLALEITQELESL